MKLIIMTRPTFFVEEDKIIETLFDEGMESLHLYKPGSEPVYSERLLTLLPEGCHRRITVHDHHYLCEEFSLRGIHLDRDGDEPPYGFRGPVSRTCHDIATLREAKRSSQYVFLGNIFDSLSTPGLKRTFTEAQLREAARRGLIDRHVYALGGQSLDNVRLMRDLGFGGIVVCGDLWSRFNIHHGEDFRDLIAHFKAIQKALS